MTVCAGTAFPPVAYSRDDRLTGHDIAFLKAFAASRKLEIGFPIFPFDGLWLRPGVSGVSAPGSARLAVYRSARDGVADLLAGKIDGFAEGTIGSDHFRADNPALAATPGYPMAGSNREFLGFPYRQAGGIGPALDARIRDNKASYGR